ncbi:putative telomerase activating protein Est1 [Lyophyllum shimeji]|uniref:Telomerase activating protein Est1 n=1 Tax=Lyophyllum shimeji TaxID=47721 RepID=A0A9P3PQY5_LYOSH|nr:putative telomerase activating protein Est1 [Lyophyllum shimeji]
MTEQPASIAREAKGIHQSLKELLKNKEPFDKEVDFQRKNLRRRYLSLLLVHPYAKESKDVENHLWMQTSYAFIASYKQRILNLDRLIQSKMRQPQQPNQRPNNVPVVEHRKLVSRFRQFLAEEEKFWSQLVVRLRRSFALDEATPALVALGIIAGTEDSILNAPEVADGAGIPPQGRNHFQFPPEDASTPFVPTNAEEKASWLAVLSKALVCLGDIARYRELYNESGGRPRAGHEEGGPTRRGRNRRGGQDEPIPRPRNYEKAQQCYEQARLLVPDDGNPSHQLAIIATYRKDSFVSLTHYYRALCVRTPYDTASENLGSVLGKALEAWKTRSRRERDRQEALPPRVQVEAFRENTVVLHALWKVGMEKGLKKMESLSRRHHKVVSNAFATLVAERYLPTDMISNAIVLSQGALWKHRMIRAPSTAQNQRPELPPPPEGTSVIIEWRMLGHLLDLHRGLLNVGREELRVPPPRDAPGDDLAQRITGTFRRSLPALRIASKWLRANFKYVLQDHEFDAYRETKRTEGVEVTRDIKYQFSRTSMLTELFWSAYARFVSDLSRTFDYQKLPQLTAPLEEDVEMRGFLPLKGMMGDIPEAEDSKASKMARQAQDAHPNDWQLMRIADLIRDAREIAKLENSPIRLMHGSSYDIKAEMFEPHEERTPAKEAAAPAAQQELFASIRGSGVNKEKEEDNMTELTSHTEDELFRDVFDRGALEQEDQEDDEIVWDPRAPISPVIAPALPSPTSHATPVVHSKPLMKSPAKHSPTHSMTLSPFMTPGAPANVASTTAKDLLNDVLSGGRSALAHLESAAPPPALLFGSELTHGQGHNIWSASREEQSLKFTSQPNQVYQGKPFQGSTGLDISGSQSIWSSSPSYPKPTPTTPSSQPHLVGTLPPALYPNQSITQSHHQRTPSFSLAPSLQPFHAQQFGAHDPLSYSLPSNQQPIHRPDALGLSSSAYISRQLPPNATNGMYYQSSPPSGYHSHHSSFGDPRLAQQHFAQTPTQLWGNAG